MTENEDPNKITEIEELVKKHNDRAKEILAMAEKANPSKDDIRGKIYEIQTDEDDINRFVRGNRELATTNSKIIKLIASTREPHSQILGVIRNLKIGR
ncbi:MAG: hypothetical protein WCQ96_00910 [Patescibacteria group bacterium]